MSLRELMLTVDAAEIAEWGSFFQIEREELERKTLHDKPKTLSASNAADLRSRIGHLVKKGKG